ncbi:hypothetical protein AURDEDRAFT_172830 [Auricularia subglabra TFB-10046 SS5]|uniref:Uncharacterized protein n=1 Tax=Auricularia subglabra (strain TFB-10046 / SS5) TaxID=717982 RepID=J0WVD7_AURST|nr:hypothetical protein AURDEDRAFT_172830 [Auricularia subglabra TFB-10046 SS5]
MRKSAAHLASAARRQVEEERDELRDAVALLAEKTDGDWRVFRPVSMRLLEPPEGRALFDMRPIEDGDDDRAAFVQPLLASMGLQLDAERRRREDAEQQVALLSAQVARREAELKARLDPEPLHNKRERMTRGAALGVLDLTLARNRTLEADVKVLEAKLKALRVYPAESPPPRPSSSRPTLVNSPQKRKALAPNRMRSVPPISPARSIRELVPPLGPWPTFSPRRPSRPRSSPSPPPSTPRSPQARPRTPIPRLPPPPAIVALDAHPLAIEDGGMAEVHRERERLAALPAHPAPVRPVHSFVRPVGCRIPSPSISDYVPHAPHHAPLPARQADPTHFARVGLLEVECVRLRRRVRELEAQKDEHLDDAAEDPDMTIRPTRPLPASLLPPIGLRPPPLVQQPHAAIPDARHPRPPDAPGLQDVHHAQAQRMAQLADELARTQDGVAERERAMDGLRAEIARLRAGNVASSA